MHQCTGVPVYQCIRILEKIVPCNDVQYYNRTGVSVYVRTSVLVHQCIGVPVYPRTGVPIYVRTGITRGVTEKGSCAECL